jgi:hypothetical protein
MSEYFRETQFSFPKYEVSRTVIQYPAGPQVRYGIPGLHGAFGYVKAAQYVQTQMEQ